MYRTPGRASSFIVQLNPSAAEIRNNEVSLRRVLTEQQEHLGWEKSWPNGQIQRLLSRAENGDRNEQDREEVRVAVRSMRLMIEREELPAPTTVLARCVGCEFRNFCADIW